MNFSIICIINLSVYGHDEYEINKYIIITMI